jgi:serine/threonine protein kinase
LGCPSNEDLLAFAEGRLEPMRLARLNEHLDFCAICPQLAIAAVQALDPRQLRSDGNSDANFFPGTLVGNRYRIVRSVGRGGMGEVYEAFDEVLEERVALKTATGAASDGQDASRRLLAEAQLARRVSHRHICRTHDVGFHREPGRDDGAVPFLTMEFIEGESLASRLLLGPMPWPEVLCFAQQLLLGLAATHAAGVLHRDLKCANIMLRRAPDQKTPCAIITDFGLALPLDAKGHVPVNLSKTLVGTLPYMAPEQLRGGPLGRDTDVFSFGIVLFEMLTGRLPSRSDLPRGVAAARFRSAPLPPSRALPGVPPLFDDLVSRCLHRQRRRRYPSAERVLQALERFAENAAGFQRKRGASPASPRRSGSQLGPRWRSITRETALVAT